MGGCNKHAFGKKVKKERQSLAWDIALTSGATCFSERLHSPHCAYVVCMQEAMKFRTIETRLHVWMLLNNLELVPAADPDCWQNRDIRYPTQMYGQPYDSLGSETNQAPYMFGMGYMRGALKLPPTADNKFFSVFNTTLAQLPQGPDARMNSVPDRLPPDIFTLLMWSVNRWGSVCGGVGYLVRRSWFVCQQQRHCAT